MTSGLFQPEMIGIEERQEAILALLQPGSGRAMAARFERYATENSIGLEYLRATFHLGETQVVRFSFDHLAKTHKLGVIRTGVVELDFPHHFFLHCSV